MPPQGNLAGGSRGDTQMKMSRTIPAVAAALVAGLAAGYFLGPGGRDGGAGGSGGAAAASLVYTCSMHPQVRLGGPGKCPICEMPLIPADSAGASAGGPPELTLSEHALKMAGVETVPAAYRKFEVELHAVGIIRYNEASLATVTARVDGYAEKLFVNITGVEIKAGDHLVEIYSPDLLVAQQELLIALQDGKAGPSAEAAMLKLRRWGMTEKQVDELVASRKMAERATLYSPISGTVIEKSIVENSSFRAGDALFRIAGLDTVWAYLDIYESDLAWIRYGQKVDLSAEACPGRIFAGTVTFIEPVLNEQTRTVRVPVHVMNERRALKPGMYVSATVKAALGADGFAAPTGVEGKFTCTMHPQVIRDEAGACPACGMPLGRIPGENPDARGAGHEEGHGSAERYFCPMKCEGEKTYDRLGNCPVCGMKLEKAVPGIPSGAGGERGLLAVPVGAVLDSGTRRIVYVEKGRGTFEPREVVVGPRGGGFLPVLKGLAEGERVVARGGFLIDSQFQITGHPSLFYPGGLLAGTGHQRSDAPGGSGADGSGGKSPSGGDEGKAGGHGSHGEGK